MKRRLTILLGTFLVLQTFVIAGDHHAHDESDDHGHENEKSHQHDEEESSGGVGPHNAITAADEHDGIKLSPKAIEFIGLKIEAYDGGVVPASALVSYQDNVGVYRLKDGWFKLVSLQEIHSGDSIVTLGIGLLRVAELDAFSTEAGHSH